LGFFLSSTMKVGSVDSPTSTLTGVVFVSLPGARAIVREIHGNISALLSFPDKKRLLALAGGVGWPGANTRTAAYTLLATESGGRCVRTTRPLGKEDEWEFSTLHAAREPLHEEITGPVSNLRGRGQGHRPRPLPTGMPRPAHEFQSWRRSLREFALLPFKDKGVASAPKPRK
jgi:hypothetical protein